MEQRYSEEDLFSDPTSSEAVYTSETSEDDQEEPIDPVARRRKRTKTAVMEPKAKHPKRSSG